MDLKSFLDTLETRTRIKEFQDDERETTGAGNFMADFINCPGEDSEVKSSLDKRSHKPGELFTRFYLSMYRNAMPGDTITPSLMLSQVQDAHLPSGAFTLSTDFVLPSENFLTAKTLGGLSKLSLSGDFHAVDPTKTRIGYQGTTHELKAIWENDTLTVSAHGEYSSLLPELIKNIKPECLTVLLSKEDAERWIRNSNIVARWVLRRLLKPQPKMAFDLPFGGGPSMRNVEVIEINLGPAMFSQCEKAIGKSLINKVDGEPSSVIQVVKKLPQGQFVLPTLQAIAKKITELKTSTAFDAPVLSPMQAKTLLDKEIDLVGQSCEGGLKGLLGFGPNTHRIRGPLVKMLAREHFGKEILPDDDDLEAGDYLRLLQEKQLAPKDALENAGEAWDTSVYEGRLFQCFRRSYIENPRTSIERFREWYVNKRPELDITGEACLDASLASGLALPAGSILNRCDIKDKTESLEDDQLVVGGYHSERSHLYIRVNIAGGSKLIDLQTWACGQMGVSFRDDDPDADNR